MTLLKSPQLPHLQNGNNICPVPSYRCGEVQGYVHDNALCTGKTCADCKQSFTVAACVTTFMLTPLWGQGAFLPRLATM